VLFEHAFCQSPLCMPSRASFLTGRCPSPSWFRQNGQRRVPDLRPLTATLAHAGWDCGLIGKLHLSN
jgi:arylsulfatase A-like enzyme